MAAEMLNPAFFLLRGFSSDKNIRRKGPLTPSTVLLVPQHLIFLTEMLDLFLHDLGMDPLAISIILGIVFIAFSLLILGLFRKQPLMVEFLLQQIIEEVVL